MKRTPVKDTFDIDNPYSLKEIKVKARTILLKEGEKAQNTYFINKGCVRLWFNNNGVEITSQFFFEGSMVASLESFLTDTPSAYYLETVENSVLFVLEKKKFDALLKDDAAFKENFNQRILNRFIYYSKHLLFFLKDKPEERYRKLLEDNPEIIQRIPQHYIASYLGITPVSLSRIRNKLLRKEKTVS